MAARILATAASVLVATAFAAPSSACDFEPVKKGIDQILDRDKAKGEQFRRAIAEGSDSLAVVGSLVPAELREKLDACRFFAAEYLAKRGFPPAH